MTPGLRLSPRAFLRSVGMGALPMAGHVLPRSPASSVAPRAMVDDDAPVLEGQYEETAMTAEVAEELAAADGGRRHLLPQ